LAASQHYYYRLIRSHHAGQGVKQQADREEEQSRTGD
jgi:hypothetical protein